MMTRRRNAENAERKYFLVLYNIVNKNVTSILAWMDLKSGKWERLKVEVLNFLGDMRL
jgi:hypothetical protein